MKETILINIVLGLFIGITMSIFNVPSIDFTGSILFGLSISLAGIIGAGIALLMAQIMPSSSSATGSALGIIGLLYILRASTDISNVDVSMINPMGWTYLTYPFTQNNWLPLLFGVIFTIVIFIVSLVLEGKRDMGAGYLPEREGRATAKNSLLSVPGLLFHINKGIIIAWLLTFFILGAAYGSIYGDMQTFLEGNELISQMFTVTGTSIEVSFTATIMMVVIGLVGILPIVLINKLYTEEVRMHFSQLYATKVTRANLYWTTIILAFISSIIGMFLGAAGLAVSALATMGDTTSMTFMDFIAAGFNFLPSTLFFIALTSLALGFLPKLGKAIYVYLGYSFIINYFAPILKFPDWFSKTAAVSWIPRMPMDAFDPLIFIVMTILSIVLIYIGYMGYKKRDMQEGA
jgi:ABC-2 type transport system permease protein